MNDDAKVPASGGSMASMLGLDGVSARAWKVVVLSLLGWLLVNADASLFNFAYPLIQADLGLSDGQIATIYTGLYTVGALSTFVAGPLMDRIGRKPIYQACLFAAILGSLITAAAPGFLILLLGRAVTHIGASTEWMAGQVMVAEEAPARSRGRLIGIAQIGYPLGFFLGALLSMLVLSQFGWRVLFLCGVLPVFLMIWARRGVEDTERFQAERARERAQREPQQGRVAQLFGRELRRSSICIALWHFTYAFGVAGIISYLPTVYEHFGIELSGVFSSSAIATGIAAFGYLLSAWLGERYGRREISALFLLLGGISGALLAFYGSNWLMLTVFYSLFYFFTLGHITSAIGFATEVFPTRVRGTGANLVAGSEWVGFIVAGATGPWLLANLGFTSTLMLWCLAAQVLAAGFALCVKRIPPNTVLEEVRH